MHTGEMTPRRGGTWTRGWVVVTLGLALAGAARAQTAPPVVPAGLAGQGVGQEMKLLEQQMTQPEVKPQSKQKKGEVKADAVKPLAPVAPGDPSSTAAKSGNTIGGVEVRGDVDLLKDLGLYSALVQEIQGKQLTDREILKVASDYAQKLIDRGYYLASVRSVPSGNKDQVVLEVDAGRVGKKNYYERQPLAKESKAGKPSAPAPDAAAPVKTPFRGKYFKPENVDKKFATLEPGTYFDYVDLYQAMLWANTTPDLTVDAELKVRREEVDGRPQRYVDMDFYVDEELPIHYVFSVANNGTEFTGMWRPTLTIQHLNLTKHNDTLTVNLGPVSTDVSELASGAASYYLPYEAWDLDSAFTLYGGYSELNGSEIVRGISINGQGYFVGAQNSLRFIHNRKHDLSAAAGITYRYIKDQLVLDELIDSSTGLVVPEKELEPREVNLVPLSLAFIYSSGEADKLGGRNYLTAQSVAHFDGVLGASDEETIQELRFDADGTYYAERIQAARLQPFSPGGSGSRQWLGFVKLDGQLSPNKLVPAEQKAIGGADSVRGFPERIAQGDQGLSGSLEIRTPLFSTFLGSPYKTKTERLQALRDGKTTDRLQIVTFLDGGYVTSAGDQLAKANYSLASVGAGLRLYMTQYVQAKFDWGVPVSGQEDLEGSLEPVEDQGRGHFSMQVQF